MTPRILILGTVLAAVLQTGVLAKIITDRASALKSGHEVLVETGFIDPRDLFRGHYTTLNLLIGSLQRADISINGTFRRDDPVYVVLDTSGPFAKPVSLHTSYPKAPKGPVLLGRANFTSDNNSETLSINFPFDRFFAAKDRAMDLQNLQRERKLGVILSVANDGSAMIKGLTIDGEKIYEEPLF